MESDIKVALAHDWLNGMRGGEKCLEAFCELFPDSPIYTLFYEKGKVSDTIARRSIATSWMQGAPNVFSHYRYYLPFFPKAMEAFRLDGFDLVISTSHCAAKGISKKNGALHICYCFTPMRYAWVFFDEYFGKKNGLARGGIKFFIGKLKEWDLKTNQGIDHFVAISDHVRKRIRQFYQRDADVVYPPVDTDFYTPTSNAKAEDFYLIVSAMVPYKKIELAVEAFNDLGKQLVVIGDGPERKRLEKMAGKNIKFLGWQADEILRNYYRSARALIFPGEEDFGIVPVEVQACGRFVIAFGRGGALETVKEGETGIFFEKQTAAGLKEAVRRFETMNLDPKDARRNAERFGGERFKREINELIRHWMAKKDLRKQ